VKIQKIREWSVDELKAKDREFAEQLFRLKFQFASGQSDVLQKMRVLRRDIARVKTLLREEELKAETSGKS
jgi:large subunit ribosomal protein L29